MVSVLHQHMLHHALFTGDNWFYWALRYTVFTACQHDLDLY